MALDPAHRQLIAVFGEQQETQSCALPMVRTADGGGDGMEFLVMPVGSLVGGMPSLHHYTLPARHLPLHHVVPADKSKRSSPFRFLNAAAEQLHPYHDHQDSVAAMCPSSEQRLTVFEDAVQSNCVDAFSFVDDLPTTASTGRSARHAWQQPQESGSDKLTLCCCALTETSLLSRGAVTVPSTASYL